jgi:hypothetical protein
MNTKDERIAPLSKELLPGAGCGGSSEGNKKRKVKSKELKSVGDRGDKESAPSRIDLTSTY